jgi:hypothetical protein
MFGSLNQNHERSIIEVIYYLRPNTQHLVGSPSLTKVTESYYKDFIALLNSERLEGDTDDYAEYAH